MAKTKALISFAVTAKLICIFVFAYADCWFSHEAAHLFTKTPTSEKVETSQFKEHMSSLTRKQSFCIRINKDSKATQLISAFVFMSFKNLKFQASILQDWFMSDLVCYTEY